MSLKEVDEQMLNVKLKNNSYFVEWINNIHLLFVHKKDLKWHWYFNSYSRFVQNSCRTISIMFRRKAFYIGI